MVFTFLIATTASYCYLLLTDTSKKSLSKTNYSIDSCKLEQRRDDQYKNHPVVNTSWGYRKAFIFPSLVVTAERKRLQVSMVRRTGHRNSFNDLLGKIR